MWHKIVMALLYVSPAGHQPNQLPKQMYFPPRPTIESCLNVNLDPWFQEQGINHAMATMMANSQTPETVVRTTARNLVLTQPGMVEDQVECGARTETLYKAMDVCQVSRRTQRSLARRFRGVN